MMFQALEYNLWEVICITYLLTVYWHSVTPLLSITWIIFAHGLGVQSILVEKAGWPEWFLAVAVGTC